MVGRRRSIVVTKTTRAIANELSTRVHRRVLRERGEDQQIAINLTEGRRVDAVRGILDNLGGLELLEHLDHERGERSLKRRRRVVPNDTGGNDESLNHDHVVTRRVVKVAERLPRVRVEVVHILESGNRTRGIVHLVEKDADVDDLGIRDGRRADRNRERNDLNRSLQRTDDDFLANALRGSRATIDEVESLCTRSTIRLRGSTNDDIVILQLLEHLRHSRRAATLVAHGWSTFSDDNNDNHDGECIAPD